MLTVCVCVLFYLDSTPSPLTCWCKIFPPHPRLFRSGDASEAKLVSLFGASCALWIFYLFLYLTLQKSGLWLSGLACFKQTFFLFASVLRCEQRRLGSGRSAAALFACVFASLLRGEAILSGESVDSGGRKESEATEEASRDHACCFCAELQV